MIELFIIKPKNQLVFGVSRKYSIFTDYRILMTHIKYIEIKLKCSTISIKIEEKV